MEVFSVIKPGLMTTIQDKGRHLYQQFGVPVSGPMDHLSPSLGNRLLDNEANAPFLEITINGPVLVACRDTLFNITGADLTPQINGKPVPLWQNNFIRKGDILSFAGRKSGCRAYLQIPGGFAWPVVMGSSSVYAINPQMLGHNPLQKGDILHQFEGETDALELTGRRLKEQYIPVFSTQRPVRIIVGPQQNCLAAESWQSFLQSIYTVDSASNRVAILLTGPRLKFKTGGDIISQATPMGTIQVNNSGQPVILMADRQTIGGYVKISTIASIDLPYIAQMFPGDKISFYTIPLMESQKLLIRQEKLLQEDIFENTGAIDFRLNVNNQLIEVKIDTNRKDEKHD